MTTLLCSALGEAAHLRPEVRLALDLSWTGKRIGPFAHRYGHRELALYALSVGADSGDLDYLLEEFGPKVLPTYGVIPTLAPVFEAVRLVGGDALKMLHLAQRTEQLAPLPPQGSVETTLTVHGIWDMVMGAFMELETDSAVNGVRCTHTRWQILFRGQGGFGGERPPATLRTRPREGSAPVFEVTVPTLPTQALLYALNGDANPVHTRPDAAKAAGFERPILHGLCTYGILGRIAIRELLGGEPARFRALEARFAKVVLPGDRLRMRGYALESPGRAALTVSDADSGAEVIGNALLEYVP